jgi:hypothetical protein
MNKRAKTTKPGVVEMIIKPAIPNEPEKAQIAVEGAEHLYREIRIENVLEDENGKAVKLKKGTHVNVTVDADPNDILPDKP